MGTCCVKSIAAIGGKPWGVPSTSRVTSSIVNRCMSCACLFMGKGTEETDMSVSVRVHNFCVCPEEETPSSALPPPPCRSHPLSPPENATVTPFRSPRQTVPSDPGFLSPSHPHLRPKLFPISPAFAGSLNLCPPLPPQTSAKLSCRRGSKRRLCGSEQDTTWGRRSPTQLGRSEKRR